MRRRHFLTFIPVSASVLIAAGAAAQPFRGKLSKDTSGKPVLALSDGRRLFLSGDDDSMGTLTDPRLANSDFEVVGTLEGDTVRILPIHQAALFVYRDGRRLRVTYWCDVCAIRTYTPGLCWCCREETELQPREPDTVDK